METGWLIENTGLNMPYYFTVYQGVMTYSADPNDAIRFSRKEDAEMMLTEKYFNVATLKVSEHSWG